jgi:hypothetical protein
MSIADLRSALATAVGTIPTGSGKLLRSSDLILDSVNPPQAVVFRNDITYDLDLGDDGSTYSFIVKVYAGRVSERAAQILLDALCEPSGAGSLKAVVEGNVALRALCDWVVVQAAGAVKVTTVGENLYLTVDFIVEIVT